MEKPKKKQLSQLLELSNLAIQMGLIIGLGTYAGAKLDILFDKKSVFTIVLSLAALFSSFYYVIVKAKKL